MALVVGGDFGDLQSFIYDVERSKGKGEHIRARGVLGLG
jgi:hypothetical protein